MTDTITAGDLAPEIEAAVRASFGRQGLMATLAAELVTIAPGLIVLEMPFSATVSQQHGYFHGGAVGAIADSAGGYAALTRMPAGSEVVSVEYKINFVRPAAGARLRAHGRVVRSGRTMSVVQSDVMCLGPGGETLCAILQATMMRVDGATA